MTNSDNVVSLVPPPAAPDEVSLYEIRRKIYPRAVHGVYARWRVALIIATQALFYGLPWLYWNGRQAVLFDLGARKFYVFGLVLWPQDVVYLTGCSSSRRSRSSCSPRSPGGCGAGTHARRPSTPRSSCGSSARSKATGSRGYASTARR